MVTGSGSGSGLDSGSGSMVLASGSGSGSGSTFSKVSGVLERSRALRALIDEKRRARCLQQHTVISSAPSPDDELVQRLESLSLSADRTVGTRPPPRSLLRPGELTSLITSAKVLAPGTVFTTDASLRMSSIPRRIATTRPRLPSGTHSLPSKVLAKPAVEAVRCSQALAPERDQSCKSFHLVYLAQLLMLVLGRHPMVMAWDWSSLRGQNHRSLDSTSSAAPGLGSNLLARHEDKTPAPPLPPSTCKSILRKPGSARPVKRVRFRTEVRVAAFEKWIPEIASWRSAPP